MNPSQPHPQGQGMPGQDPAGSVPGMSGQLPPAPPLPPEASMTMPVAGSSAAPDPSLLPPAPGSNTPTNAADAAWLPPTTPLQPPKAGGGAAGQLSVPVPAVADDGDLIEKEWVTKAKEIVVRTRQDPHRQTKELHQFKAEYMKKRYNKVIEPVEE